MFALLQNKENLGRFFLLFVFVFLSDLPAFALSPELNNLPPKPAKKIAVKKESSESPSNVRTDILERQEILKSLNEFHQTWEVLDLFSGEAHKNAGDYLLERQSFSEAEKEFNRALELEYRDSSLYLQLGLLRMRENDLQVAMENFRAALSLKPDSPTIHNQLGELYARQKKYSLAEKEFSRAVELNPNSESALLNLGNLFYYFKKNFLHAKAAYSKALEINPNLDQAKNNLQIILAGQKKAAAAEKEFAQGEDLDHDFLKDDSAKNSHFLNF